MSGSAAAVHNVFAYGSLLADDVVRVLLNRIPPSSAALLTGFHRFSIKGRVYPAILPVQNDQVIGKVLLGITDTELHILDEFEDVEYQKTQVEVSLLESSDKLKAHAYVWNNANDPNLFGDWNFEKSVKLYCKKKNSLDWAGDKNLIVPNPKFSEEEWARVHKESFIKMTTGFMEELELPEPKPRVTTYESFYQQDAGK